MSENLFESEVQKGAEFKIALDRLMSEFTGDLNYDVEAWKDLLLVMLDFDKVVKTGEIRSFLYGYISRAALNAKDYKLVVPYAKGAIILSSINNDSLGVNSAKQVLCDFSCMIGDFSSALNYYLMIFSDAIEKNDETALALSELIESKPSKRKEILDSQSLPETIDFPGTMRLNENYALGKVSELMGVNINEAKKYGVEAKKLIKEEILKKEGV